MATKITSPIEGFSERSTFGPVTLEFKDGVAETDEKLSDGLKAYLKRRGYKIGKATSQDEGDGPFDPAKHNQDDVVTYLSRDGIEAEEVERVLAAEATRENGARQKIAAWAEARTEAAKAAEEQGGQGDGGGDGA